MKKILLLIAGGVLLCTSTSCDNDPKNPGDFSIKSQLTLGDIVSLSTGERISLNVARELDTVFQHGYEYTDTITGVTETRYYSSKFVSHFYEMEPVVLPFPADTFKIDLYSNAKWQAPRPERSGIQWYFNMMNLTSSTSEGDDIAGGGDGSFYFRVTKSTRTSPRVNPIDLYIWTNDSTVMYKIPFNQHGEKEVF